MKTKYFLAIILLSALWGFSFLFMKISSPEMGAIFTTNLRVLISAFGIIWTALFLREKITIQNIIGLIDNNKHHGIHIIKFYNPHFSKACLKSFIISSGSSRPTLNLRCPSLNFSG